MKKKILYIYGYESSATDSRTMESVKAAMDKLGYDVVSVAYSQTMPRRAVKELEDYVKSNGIEYIIGHSLGGFYALCVNVDVKKILINPCMKPHIELPKLHSNEEISPTAIAEFKQLYDERIKRNINVSHDLLGLFGLNDELFCYYKDFSDLSPYAYFIQSGHRITNPNVFTKDIIDKIRIFLEDDTLNKILSSFNSFEDEEEI